VVGAGGFSEELCEEWPQSVSPDLVAFYREMEPIPRHALEQISLGIGELVIDIEIEDTLSIRELGD
jgi:hypothetical protein